MTCDEIKFALADYWSHSLSADREAAVEAHLAVCSTCQTEAERLGTLWRGLGLLPGEEQDPSQALRDKFYATLAAYREGFQEKSFSTWLRKPLWQMAAGLALLAVGAAAGYGFRSSGGGAEIAQLREEVNNMRQLVALSLLQQQSASERLRGVSWAYRVEPPDTQMLDALLSTVNHDPNINVRLAAVDALHPFAESSAVREKVMQALAMQNAPLVQVALIDLLVDLKEKDAARPLERIAADGSADAGVRQRAQWALERLQ